MQPKRAGMQQTMHTCMQEAMPHECIIHQSPTTGIMHAKITDHAGKKRLTSVAS